MSYNTTPQQFIVEGVDRMGKSTLIKNLLNALGYHLVIHFGKPQVLDHYSKMTDQPLKLYQVALYNQMFEMIERGDRLIFDRGHLGELVYAPLYRKYNADYVLEFEAAADTSNTRLVLLTTSDFSFIEDDGLSIDFSKKEEEQDRFIHAFKRSSIVDKVIVDVSKKGKYKEPKEILAEVLRK